MSVKVSGLVWDCQLPREEKFLLLAYADHADHDGTNVYPSRATVTRMTGYSRRSVQTITAKMVEKGLLIVEGESRLQTVQYRFDMDKLREGGAETAPRAKTAPVQKSPPGGAVATAPNPSVVDPSEIEFASANGEPVAPPVPPFDTFWRLYPRKVGKQAALNSWTRQKLDAKADRVLPALTEQLRAGMFNLAEPRFIPNPATWLNQGRWEDAIIKTTHEKQRSKTHIRVASCNAANAGTALEGKARNY